RYLMGHLSDNTYRDYTGAAGQILAERHRTSVVDAWTDRGDHPGAPRAAAVQSGTPPHALPGPGWAGGAPRGASRAADTLEAAELIDAVRANPALARALLQALRG